MFVAKAHSSQGHLDKREGENIEYWEGISKLTPAQFHRLSYY